MIMPEKVNCNTVEILMKESRLFLISLDRLLISGVIFSRFLYTAHALCVFTLFSAEEFLMICDSTLKSEFLYNNFAVQLQKCR